MTDRRYLLLVNDAIKMHLARMPANRRQQFREKMEFLQNGLWDTGVRVKKLRGSARIIFEARLNRSERLLFTLGHHHALTAIYLWGLVAHDDISAAAQRIEPSNAPFLDFEELEHEDRTELVFDDLSALYFTQEGVEEKVPDDYGPQRWLVFNDEELHRLLASPDPDSYEVFLHLTGEQEQLLATAPPILISGTAGSGKTTLSVYYLLRGAHHGARRLFVTYNPLLKRMAERIYAGLAEKRAGTAATEPPRFALFREIAVDAAGGVAAFPPEKEVRLREFIAIMRDHKDRRRIDPELVWEEIRSIIKGATVPIDPRRCVFLVQRVTSGTCSAAERQELLDYCSALGNLGLGRKAESSLARRSLCRSWDDFLLALASPSDRAPAALRPALQTVADLVAKHSSDFSRPLLPLDDYLALGRKRAPNFHHDREALYEVAQFYQERLERSGKWDEIDLARTALRRKAADAPGRGSPEARPWDLVVCDEVQDLADVQIALLFRLVSDPRSVVLTGDPRQIINPTGFRWEEVRYRFRERGLPPPEIHRLSLNFRCVGPIVRLSNALLDLKASLVGLSDTEMREEWKFGGRPPLVLEEIPEEELLERLRKRGAQQVILTRESAEAARLRKLLDTELVFTISEAKGLEFDTVLLWRFAQEEGAKSIWRSIASGDRPQEDRLPHVRHELALMYVAVTRARNTLLAWDGEASSPVWSIPGIADRVFLTKDLHLLTELWKTASSAADWEKEGDYYFERERWAAARECYRNAAAGQKAERAHARALHADGQWGEAAPLLERLGEITLAADCWEQARMWAKAEKAWRAAGQPLRARACFAQHAESQGRIAEAAQAWEELGELKRSEALWRRAGAFDRLARLALSARHYAEAGDLFERAHLAREAAGAWEKAKQYDRAGDLLLRLGDHAKAARLFHRAHNWEKELRCLRQLGKHREVGLLLEKLGQIEKAVEAFALAAAESQESRSSIEEGVPAAKTRRTQLKAAIRMAALGRDVEAADLFFQAGALEAAQRRYQQAGNHGGVARCHERAGRWLEAAHELDLARGENDTERCDSIQQFLYRHVKATGGHGRDQRELQVIAAEAERLRDQGNLIGALARFRLLAVADEVIQLSRRLDWHEQAITWLLVSGHDEGALAYARSGGFAVTREFFDRVTKVVSDTTRYSRRSDEAREALFFLLSALAETLPLNEARDAVEDYLEQIFGGYFFLDMIPDGLLALLLRTRAAKSIMSLLSHEMQFLRETNQRLRNFAEQLRREAKESADLGLAACWAWYQDYQRFHHPGEEFEKAAAELTLSGDTASILGFSSRRYQEAVNLLMEGGEFQKAERFCRIHGNPRLAAQWAEKRRDFAGAARSFHEARDMESALRCAVASGDQRLVARVHEWRGELKEALRIWKKLGLRGNAARLLRKYPLLNNPET